MSGRIHDSGKNSPYKRGLIKEVDAAKARAKVTFADEGGNVSFWLNVNQAGTGANKSYSMPDVGSQVNCLVDWDGEDGTILGAAFSEADKPPTSDGDTMHVRTEAGTDIIINKKTGAMSIKGASDIVIEAGTLTVKADVAFEGEVTSNGKDISSTHKHVAVMAGPATTGVPQ